MVSQLHRPKRNTPVPCELLATCRVGVGLTIWLPRTSADAVATWFATDLGRAEVLVKPATWVRRAWKSTALSRDWRAPVPEAAFAGSDYDAHSHVVEPTQDARSWEMRTAA
jgi:hypothetical protein